jgi:2-polyprenyl-6-methoxyphenol hydroxylase-like FAD-dependent oxidoreductase
MRLEMAGRSAVVVGGGIGGLAAAGALAMDGWRVTLFEQAPEFGPVGAGVGLAPNAVRAMDRLGLGGQLRTRGMVSGLGIRTASGRWLTELPAERLSASVPRCSPSTVRICIGCCWTRSTASPSAPDTARYR